MIDDPEIPTMGVLPLDDRSACWRVWTPKAKRVELVLDLENETKRIPMRAEARGHFATEQPLPEVGQRYAYALDDGPPRPDPLSRWQPEGVFGTSAVDFPDRFRWEEGSWNGIDRRDLVFYELHVGTFTAEGTFEAIIPRLEALKDLGITAIELMPVNQFPGDRSWGYDGVFPFAVQNSYGGPEALRRLINECHCQGLAVFLDLVLNHFGPEGNVFPTFGHYFNEHYRTDWGPAINFDSSGSGTVRAMVHDLVRMWVRDYRFDGLRLDAADQIYDRSPSPILAEVAEIAHSEAARLGRSCHVFAETDLNNADRFLGPTDRGGFALDGQWNDDFHHAAHVVLTGDTSGYFKDFSDGPAALAKVFEHIFFNNGNYSPFRDRRHGTPATAYSGDRFLAFTQNHDQIANGNAGHRHAEILKSSATRLAAGLLMLAPRLPMLFQGEEYGETNPFPYFCSYQDSDLVEAVRQGRQQEFAQFGREGEKFDPNSSQARDEAVLSWDWTNPFRQGLRLLHQELLVLRRTVPALREFGPARTLLHGTDVLEVIRASTDPDQTLRIFFNFSGDVRSLPTNLVDEQPVFRSELPKYGSNVPRAKTQLKHLHPHEFALFGSISSP